MSNFTKKYNFWFLAFLGVFILSIFLRFYNLSYSDYQGDEIKALYNVRNNKEFYEFLFDQKKGPNQFLVTSILREVSNDYYNYFILRLPFALAGILSVLIFYRVVKNYFQEKVALYATIFFGSSGFLVAFSRIVQYQSFVILLGLLSILCGQFFDQTKKKIFLYLGFISLALAILFHYDGIFFGVPFAILIFKNILEDRKGLKSKVNYFLSGLLFVGILASFYIPFVLNLDNATLSYFQERIEGVGGEQKISSSFYNFNLYQPYFSFYIYLFFGIIGGLVIFKNIRKLEYISVLIWIFIAFLFMEILIKSPGTHIYTYLIPLMIVCGLGIEKVYSLISNKNIKLIYGGILITLSVHLYIQSFVLFVENSKEYPWQDKNYLYFDLKALTQEDNKKYYLSLFGFPYNRNWLEIREFLKNENATYDSSEKSTIGNFYLRNLKFKNYGDIYVEIENPQSFSRANRKELTPIKTFNNPNGTKSLIYQTK
jgi:4-amino-4-deoxy-L-arabinose transferase-like glycosyltransferase